MWCSLPPSVTSLTALMSISILSRPVPKMDFLLFQYISYDTVMQAFWLTTVPHWKQSPQDWGIATLLSPPTFTVISLTATRQEWQNRLKMTSYKQRSTTLFGLCFFGANLVQHSFSRYIRCTRYSTISHDRLNDTQRYTRFYPISTLLNTCIVTPSADSSRCLSRATHPGGSSFYWLSGMTKL